MRPRLVLLSALCAALWLTSPWVARAQPPPVSSRDVLGAIAEDPAPPALINGRHFLISNENHPHYFHDTLSGRGGLLLGVGAEQSYFFAGWARAEALVLLDFDRAVADLHAAYAVFFRRTDGPKAFLRAWSHPGQAEARRWLRDDIADEALRGRTLHIYELVRAYVWMRLTHVQAICHGARVPTFLDDPEQFRHLAELFRAGRVRALRGDLKGEIAMRGVATAARQLGVPVRVVYLSNAEDYFGYAATRLDDNLLELPFDPRSVILRTTSNQGGPHDFRYLVQDAADFGGWMRRGDVQNLGVMLQRAAPRPSPGAWRIAGPPP